MLEIVKEFIEEENIFPEKAKILVGFSGGSDSTALLHMLVRLAELKEYQIYAAHLNHKLRGEESERDQKWAEEFCRRLGVKLVVESSDVKGYAKMHKMSLEEAARKIRYDFLDKVKETFDCQYIALGHHKGDQAETVLLNLLRGSGLKGLGGMKPIRGSIARPLLCLKKKGILAYCAEEELMWVEDTSNQDVAFTRNRIRNNLLPLLEAYNPRVVEALYDMASSLRKDEDFIEGYVRSFMSNIMLTQKDHLVVVKRQDFMSGHKSIRTRALRKIFFSLNKSSLERRYIELFNKFIFSQKRKMALPGNIVVEKKENEIVFLKNVIKSEKLVLEIKGTGEYFFGENIRLLLRTTGMEKIGKEYKRGTGTKIYLDADKVDFPIRARNLKEGDSYQPLGFHGHRKVKDMMREEGIDRFTRSSVPVVEESGGKIVWAYGLRPDNNYIITEYTKNVLIIEASQGL